MTTNAERAQALARLLGAALDADEVVIATLCTEDVRVWTPTYSVSSRTELIALLGRRNDAMSDIDVTLRTLDVGDSRACAEWAVTFTHSGPISRVTDVLQATGARATVHGITVAEFDGDQICAIRQYSDETVVLDRLPVGNRPNA
jgi:hypothetical protein